MKARSIDVTDAELGVLRHLWDHGPSSTRSIAEAVYPDKPRAPAATVLKLLERLEQKGFVLRDSSAHVQHFSAKIDRDGLIARRLNAVADDLCDGSRTPLLMHLVGSRDRLSRADIDALRSLVNELDHSRSNA